MVTALFVRSSSKLLLNQLDLVLFDALLMVLSILHPVLNSLLKTRNFFLQKSLHGGEDIL